MPDVREARQRKRARRLHQTCLSRGVPATREAQSQVRKREEQAAGVMALRGSLTQKKDCIQRNSRAWERPPRVHDRERQESSEPLKEAACASDEETETILATGIKSHTLALEVLP